MSRAWDHYFSEDLFGSVRHVPSDEAIAVVAKWRASRTATGIQQMREQAYVGISREVAKMQRIQNGITNSILDMLRTPQYLMDAMEWEVWLLQNPVRKPKWRN